MPGCSVLSSLVRLHAQTFFQSAASVIGSTQCVQSRLPGLRAPLHQPSGEMRLRDAVVTGANPCAPDTDRCPLLRCFKTPNAPTPNNSHPTTKQLMPNTSHHTNKSLPTPCTRTPRLRRYHHPPPTYRKHTHTHELFADGARASGVIARCRTLWIVLICGRGVMCMRRVYEWETIKKYATEKCMDMYLI